LENDFNVLSVGGDHRLGGKDFDDRILGFIEDKIKSEHGVDIEGDIELEAELRLKAEAAS
jgi:molecular chaperone DnaK